MPTNLTRAQPFSLKGHGEWNEAFVQQHIADDPSVLGLGNLLLRDKERTQPGRGRLDVLLQSEDRQAWYEVEIQLGATDEAHIIRTIEYWDVERKRYPEISHTAVIVAEEITSRFFNVISLFNQSIPLVAIKMTAVRVGEHSTILFSKVLDYLPKGLEEEDETVQLADRGTWERRSGNATLSFLDLIMSEAKTLDASTSLKFNQSYIGTQVAGKTSNFVTFQPQNRAVRISLHIAESQELDDQLDQLGLSWEYKAGRYPCYSIRVLNTSLSKYSDFVRSLVTRAYREVEASPFPA